MKKLKFDAATQASLDASGTKTTWSDTVKTQLGTTRTVQVTRYATQADADAGTNGTVLLEGSNVGAIPTAGGSITGMGSLVSFTTFTAMDLSTGVHVMRVAGGGNFVEGTLGLPGSDCDWIASENPTPDKGIGFGSIILNPPKFLPSGLGNPSPTVKTVETPDLIELYDWTNPASPVLVGSFHFDDRQPDLVYDHPKLQDAIGDVGVYQSTQSIVFGQFEFGGMMFAMHPSINAEDNTKPVYQVLIGCKPYGVWATYPAMDTYDTAHNDTFPQPFKIQIKNAVGTVLHTYEMSDGLPINSPQLSMVRDGSNQIRPWFNCAMMLPWQSHQLTMSKNYATFFPGVTSDGLRESQAVFGDAVNGPFILMNRNGTQLNGLGHWKVMPQWPMTGSDQVVYPISPTIPDIDALYSGAPNSASYKAYRAMGWDYEVGSVSGHDWYSGPGGPRFDRATIPSAIAFAVSDPNGVRAQGNVPYRTLVDSWNLAYFNHSHHTIRDVKTFATLPDDEVLGSQWSYSRGYYGGGTSYVTGGPAKHVDMRCLSSGGTSSALDSLRDKNGRLPFNGWALDFLHNYCQPGWAALLFNSPMHLVSAKLRHHHSIICQMGYVSATKDPSYWFMVRHHAWKWLQAAMMWTLSTNHHLGLTRKQIEDRWQLEMEAIYNYIVVPTTDPSHPKYNSIFCKGYRNLGMAAYDEKDNGALSHLRVNSSALTYYIAHVLQFMKTTGSWDVMYNKNSTCKASLDFLIRCLDMYSIDFILDTDGREEAYISLSGTASDSNTRITDVPASWADWAATIHPRVGVEDWIHNSDGTFRVYERDNTMHLRAQYAFIRRDYFPEFPNARLLDACAKYQGYYDQVAAQVAVQVASGNKSVYWMRAVNDWHYRIPPHAILKAPT